MPASAQALILSLRDELQTTRRQLRRTEQKLGVRHQLVSQLKTENAALRRRLQQQPRGKVLDTAAAARASEACSSAGRASSSLTRVPASTRVDVASDAAPELKDANAKLQAENALLGTVVKDLRARMTSEHTQLADTILGLYEELQAAKSATKLARQEAVHVRERADREIEQLDTSWRTKLQDLRAQVYHQRRDRSNSNSGDVAVAARAADRRCQCRQSQPVSAGEPTDAAAAARYKQALDVVRDLRRQLVQAEKDKVQLARRIADQQQELRAAARLAGHLRAANTTLRTDAFHWRRQQCEQLAAAAEGQAHTLAPSPTQGKLMQQLHELVAQERRLRLETQASAAEVKQRLAQTEAQMATLQQRLDLADSQVRRTAERVVELEESRLRDLDLAYPVQG